MSAFRRNPSVAIGCILVALMIVAAVLGPILVHRDPDAIDLALTLARPSRLHPLGCDALGRDMLARMVYGARLSLGVSLTVVAISIVIGTLIGGAAALSGGMVESVVMRLVDIILAFPGILLAIALAAILGPGLTGVVIALSAMGWTGYARLVRGEILSLREREYVQAAHSLGAGRARMLMRHLIPAIGAALVVQATFGIGGTIVAEASLSFLGLGATPPMPSWGNMLDAGRAFLLVAPHLTTVPGVAIGLSVLGFNLLGDGLAQVAGRRPHT